jgi:hypothetical protein
MGLAPLSRFPPTSGATVRLIGRFSRSSGGAVGVVQIVTGRLGSGRRDSRVRLL